MIDLVVTYFCDFNHMFKNIKIGNIFIWSVMKSMNIMITQSRKKLISETVSGNKIKFINKIHTNI